MADMPLGLPNLADQAEKDCVACGHKLSRHSVGQWRSGSSPIAVESAIECSACGKRCKQIHGVRAAPPSDLASSDRVRRLRGAIRGYQ